MVKGTNEKPLVSIIINCFNGDKYLKEAINSIYNQSYHNWEIIFWDNQSTDESANIAKSFDQKLKYFYASNHTPLGEARNEAVNLICTTAATVAEATTIDGASNTGYNTYNIEDDDDAVAGAGNALATTAGTVTVTGTSSVANAEGVVHFKAP